MKKLLCLTLLAACLLALPCHARRVVLEKNTALVPQGWSVADEDIKFKKGTAAELNENGEVVSGVLSGSAYLRPAGWKNVINDYYYAQTAGPFFPRFFHPPIRFGVLVPTYGHVLYQKDGMVVFAGDGTVLSGYTGEKVTVSLQEGKYGFVTFKSGTLLKFDAQGRIVSGLLAADTLLRPDGWQTGAADKTSAGFLKFKKNKNVSFTPEGLVGSGTLKKETQWRQPDGSLITLPAGKLVLFSGGRAEAISEDKTADKGKTENEAAPE